MTDAQKETQKRWVAKNRDKINEINRQWRKANKEKFKQMVLKRRKKVAQELKAKGMIYTYLPRTKREMKTIEYIVRNLNVNEDQAREILIIYGWNVKKILEEFLTKNRR